MEEKLRKLAVAMSIMEGKATPPTPGEFRMTKSEAGYGDPAKGEDYKNCDNCRSRVNEACAKVHGSVSRTKVCDLWDGNDD